jgi:hypothetical protein
MGHLRILAQYNDPPGDEDDDYDPEGEDDDSEDDDEEPEDDEEGWQVANFSAFGPEKA